MGGWSSLAKKDAEVRKLQANVDVLLSEVLRLEGVLERVVRGDLIVSDGGLVPPPALNAQFSNASQFQGKIQNQTGLGMSAQESYRKACQPT